MPPTALFSMCVCAMRVTWPDAAPDIAVNSECSRLTYIVEYTKAQLSLMQDK